MKTDSAPRPHDVYQAPNALWLPRAGLDALLQHALAQQRRSPAAMLLAHAPLVLQSCPAGQAALAGPVSTEPLHALLENTSADIGSLPKHGLVLVAIPPAGTVLPQGDDAWEAWLLQTAPDYRLATSAVNPTLLVLWLRLDGLGTLMARPSVRTAGEEWGRAPGPRWVQVPHLHLPGSGMARVDFVNRPVARAPAPVPVPQPAPLQVSGPPDPDSRDGRQAAAFGAERLHRLQRSRIVLVGVGRVGSVLAHGLLRLGVQHLTVIDPDEMEPHNLDGDLAPLYEGRSKVEALQGFVRGLHRPGSKMDLRQMPVSSASTGPLVAQADVVVVCVDNDAARLWANAWALAYNRCLLAVATGIHEHGAEVDLRLIAAGSGCLACVGGFVQVSELLQQLSQDGPVPLPADFRRQRRGSLRSWSALAAHMGQRLLELHLMGSGGGALFRQVAETPQGGLQVRDWRPAEEGRLRACPYCHNLQGAGQAAITPQRLRALTQRWLGEAGASALAEA